MAIHVECGYECACFWRPMHIIKLHNVRPSVKFIDNKQKFVHNLFNTVGMFVVFIAAARYVQRTERPANSFQLNQNVLG